MEKLYLVNVEFQEIRVAVLENKILKSYFVERIMEKGIFGNIYKGKVESVIQGMQAAFVNVGFNTNGFLHISAITHRVNEYDDVLEGEKVVTENLSKNDNEESNIKKLLKNGQEILVQIIREPINSKGPRLTTHISLPGRYLVLMPFDKHIGISRRIENREKRKFLKSIVSELKLPEGMGIIFRTSAYEANKKEIISEFKYLLKLWKNLDKKAKASSAPCMIYEERDLVLRVIRDMVSDDTTKVLIDSKQEYKRSLHFARKFSNKYRKKIKYYKSDVHLFEKFNVKREIENLYERKVELKTGGYIVIESTESLVSIDVNSGGYTGKKDLEDTAYFVNMQAAEEIIKQIKLRDLGGIIIIDFIDMNEKKHIDNLLDKVGKLLKTDKSENDYWYSPKAGLVEMTRQRSRKNIKSISYQECPYCEGRGMVKSPSTVALKVIRDINKIVKDKDKNINKLYIKLNSSVVEILKTKFKNVLEDLEYKKKINIVLEKESDFHIEKIEFRN